MSAEPERGPRTRLVAAAALLAASVLLSRGLGYVREAVLAYRVGVGKASDAYYAAFQLPDLLNYFLAGAALSVAFIPFYTRALRERGPAAAQRLFEIVLGTTGFIAVVATLALWWWADSLVALLFSGFDAGNQALTVRLTRIVLPAQVFFVTGGILRAVLMAHGRFGAQAAAPLIYNGAIIAGGLFLAPHLGVEGFAWGALVGALLGPFLVPLLDARLRVRIRARIAPLDRDLLAYLAIAGPLMLGLSLLTVDEWYDKIFGNHLGEGVVALLSYARRLMQAPVAVVGQAIATAALPTLAALWSLGQREELRRVLLQTLQVGLFLGVLSGAAFVALADPVVQILYLRGAFGVGDAERVGALLRVFSLAVPAWVAQQIGARAFYARGDTWRPMLLGTGVALAAVPLYLWLGREVGAAGLAWAGVAAMSVNALLTLALARRLHGDPAPRPLLATTARSLAIAIPAALAAFAVQGPGGGLGPALRDLAVGGVVFAATAAAAVALVGDEPMRETLWQVARRVPGLRPSA